MAPRSGLPACCNGLYGTVPARCSGPVPRRVDRKKASSRGDTSFSKTRVPDDPSFAPDFARLAIVLKMASRRRLVARARCGSAWRALGIKPHPSARDHRRRVVTRGRALVNNGLLGDQSQDQDPACAGRRELFLSSNRSDVVATLTNETHGSRTAWGTTHGGTRLGGVVVRHTPSLDSPPPPPRRRRAAALYDRYITLHYTPSLDSPPPPRRRRRAAAPRGAPRGAARPPK